MREIIYMQVGADFHKKRLDDFLFENFHSLSKMYLREAVKTGGCEINGYSANVGVVVKTNDFIEITLDLDRETAMRPENVPLEIVHEEAAFLIVNKPAEMLVHPTHRDKNGTLLNALAYHLNREVHERITEDKNGAGESKIENRKSKIVRPGLVHRLDKKTSGLILIAKTACAHRVLSDHFQRKLTEKKYLAVVEGTIEADAGEIVAPIGRFEDTKHWNVKADGKLSETRYRTIERGDDATLLELQPITGRTNQLRIHCEHIGHPIIGDEKRGARPFQRLCLHAFQLSFHHPETHRRLTFEIGAPEDFYRIDRLPKSETKEI